jgi:hypothetical protein
MMKDVAGDNTSKTTFDQARLGEVVRSDAAHKAEKAITSARLNINAGANCRASPRPGLWD